MNKDNKISVGIDFSMTSPALCVHTGNVWDIKNCKFYYFVKTKKCQVKSKMLDGVDVPIYQEGDDLSRWEANSNWAMNILLPIKDKITKIGIEGYSYGSKGSMVFDIAENTVILKYNIRKLLGQKKLNIFSPGNIKKYATGKGNSKKDAMYESFINETKYDLTKELNSKPDKNPISDIVDAYWICKLVHHS